MTDPSSPLRIACLLPSATSICAALGLDEFVVGVTHECPKPKDSPKTGPYVLTKDGLPPNSTQEEIHLAVQKAAASCALPNKKSIPSLYPLLQDKLEMAKPTVVFTQNLCAVCAPTEEVVTSMLHSETYENGGTAARVVSLTPHTLEDVSDNFVTVASSCGIEERGLELKRQWLNNFNRLKRIIEDRRDQTKSKPRMLILEWLDPPFDGGHWTPQMMDYACAIPAVTGKQGPKSKHTEWSAITEMDPDVIVVGCCGFDLERNVRDVYLHAEKLRPLRASKKGNVFACNGNEFIAQPGPPLLQGAVVLAKCAYYDQPKVLKAIDDLGFFGSKEEEDIAWTRVDVASSRSKSNHISAPKVASIPDIEDMGISEDLVAGFAQMHQEACEKGEHTYDDPATGYSVFTEVAHKARGWCCGSGCRHCPYSHKNVKDKASKIQQPALLYVPEEEENNLFSLDSHSRIKVLFFSGGKDSFLTIRALAKQNHNAPKSEKFGLVLLTTFDASSRTIAHQHVPIDDVIRQATHLKIALLGIPLRRSSGETYRERVLKGLKVVENWLQQNGESKISALVFGDLHLEHIKEWRTKALTDLGYALEYPLWKVPYMDLMDDLEESQVPCYLSGVTVDAVSVGMEYNRELFDRATASGLDGFGERGEFHSLAKVWEVPRASALGVKD